jgi:hypothetical protein
MPVVNGVDTPVPPRTCVIAGLIAWDDCECGQLVVSIAGQWASSQPPNPIVSMGGASAQSKCGAPYHVIDLRVNILRCSPSGEDDPSPPTCEALDVAALIATIDAWAVRVGAECCLRDLSTRTGGVKEIEGYALQQQPMIGPAGGCQGSELQVLVWINNGCPCDALETSS